MQHSIAVLFGGPNNLAGIDCDSEISKERFCKQYPHIAQNTFSSDS
jgi:hypothetical protein